jgi:hypothetical protein
VAILVYGYILVMISVWFLSWIGLTPKSPTILKFYPTEIFNAYDVYHHIGHSIHRITGIDNGIISKSSHNLIQSPKTILNFLQIFYLHLSPLGPSTLLVSFCLSLKKHKNSFSLCAKLFLFWSLVQYLSWFSVSMSVLADLGFVVLTVMGLMRVIRYSFSTAQVLAPTVAVVLVDLQRLRVE